MHRRSATLAAAVVALAIAGCGGTDLDLGGGDDIDAPAGGYEEAAGLVCEQVAARFAEAQVTEPKTFAQGDEVVRSLLDIAMEGETQLATLDPPEDRSDAFARYLEARAEVVTLLERARDAAAAEDGAVYERARRGAIDGADKRGKLAREAGLPACAKVETG